MSNVDPEVLGFKQNSQPLTLFDRAEAHLPSHSSSKGSILPNLWISNSEKSSGLGLPAAISAIPSPTPPATEMPAPQQPEATKKPPTPGTDPITNCESGVYPENPAT